MVNVTYVGDTLIACKVTGDDNVPRGQVSFTADLSPKNDTALEPLKLSLDQSSPTATKLPRYSGKGQVAKPGFVDHKFVDGQLVMFEKHFSFVWIKTRHHVLFRRPTPEQTLSMLRDTISQEDEVENMRSHLDRCFRMDTTDSVLARRDASSSKEESEPFRRIATQSELKRLEEEQQQQRQQGSLKDGFNFWSGFRWKTDYFSKKQQQQKEQPESRDDYYDGV